MATDLSSYSETVQLFRRAFEIHGKIDHAPVRINHVCADATAFPGMDPTLIQGAKDVGLKVNPCEYVTRVLCEVSTKREVSGTNGMMRQLHGTTIVCSRDHHWEFEDEIQQNLQKSTDIRPGRILSPSADSSNG